MMCCWLCLPKPWFCFFFPRPFRLSLSWSLSLYLFPIYSPVYFSSSLFSEKKQGKQFLFWSVLSPCFLPFVAFLLSLPLSPSVLPLPFFCGLSFSGFYSQRTMLFHPLIAGVMVVVGG
jgi:hypothetical protein